MFKSELKGYVHEVAGFLDEDAPAWVETLTDAYGDDLSGLRMNVVDQCVVSAVFGDYTEGIDRLFTARDINVHNISVCGLYNPIGQAVAHYWVHAQDEVTLREAWLDEINARRNDSRDTEREDTDPDRITELS